MAKFLTRPNGRYMALVSLLIFFWLAINTSLQKNPTTDEPVHVTRGITLWQQGDYRLQQEHTPLSHWLNGLLTQTEILPDVTTRDGWHDYDRLRVSRDLIWHSGLSVERLFFLARLPIILLALLCGAVLLNWAKAIGGETTQMITAVLFSFAPNVLAHASLATTDFAATAGYLFTVYAVWRYQKRPTRGRYIAVGLIIGFALGAKMTSLLLWPIVLGLLYARKRPGQTKLQPLYIWLGWFPIAGMIVWGLYRYTLGPVYIPQIDLTLPLPAPAYWHSFFGVTNHIDGGHRAFFLGTISDTGWLHYFTVALWLKTPVLLLFGTICGTLVALQSKKNRVVIYFWLPVLALYLAATISRLNIGYRHILPLVPFLQIWTALTLATWIERDWNGRLTRFLTVALIAYAGLNLYIHPHYISYFNPLVGGPSQGYRYLGDSNLDWGQDWQTISRYVNLEDQDNTYIAPFGFVDPSYYGLTAEKLVLDSGFANQAFSPANPNPGTYFLSTNGFQGMLAQPDLFDWFRRQTAVDLHGTGYSIRRYDVAEKTAGNWIAHCAIPTPLLDEATAEQILNTSGIRHLYFDCEQSWVYPENGRAGWYILPLHITPDWALDQHPTALKETYRHQATVFAPSYRVYYWDGSQPIVTHPISTESFGDVVQLIAYTAEESDQWRTIWQVTNETGFPLSVLGHLYTETAEPAPPLTADGLGFPPSNWKVGDVFVQTHYFPNLLNDQTIDRLETGLYDYTTQERLPLPNGETTISLSAP